VVWQAQLLEPRIFSAAWKKKKGDSDEGGTTPASSTPDEFKVALAAITTPEDFAALQEQFGEIKD